MRTLGDDVAIDSDENVTGTGLQLFLFTEIFNTQQDTAQGGKALPSLVPPPTFGGTLLAWQAEIKPLRVRILRAWAREANAHAIALTPENISGPVQVTSYNVLPDDDIILIDANTAGGNVTLNLPTADALNGRQRRITVKNTTMGGFRTIITRATADTVDGAVSILAVGDWTSIPVISDGVSAWYSV